MVALAAELVDAVAVVVLDDVDAGEEVAPDVVEAAVVGVVPAVVTAALVEPVVWLRAMPAPSTLATAMLIDATRARLRDAWCRLRGEAMP